jgi:hypothetical protein
VLGLEVELSSCVDHGPCMDFNSDCGDEVAFELVSVDEEGHWLDCHGVACSPGNREDGGVFNHVCMAIGIREIDLKARITDLNERWQSDLVVTLLGLIETESVVYWRDRWHNLEHLSHSCLIIVHQDEDLDLSRSDHLL